MNVRSDQLLERANLLLAQGRSKDAESFIKQALQNDPENDYALSLLARAFYDQKKTDEGIEAILRAIQVDPERSHYYYLLAFGYYQKHIGYAAIANLEAAIKLSPRVAEYFGLLAFVLIEEKDFKEALAKANEGLAADAENATCLNARSMALNKLRMTDDAIATMQDALAKHPENEFTHATVGWNYLEKGRHKDAAKHFREALRIDPDYKNAKTGLKEALKSKIAPYRWLLKYSFWLRNKGKQFRWVFILVIFFGVRIVVIASNNSPRFENAGLMVGALYFLFVAMSWIINPLANLFLLLHKEGKYALTNSEKWNAIIFSACVFIGISLVVLSVFIKGNDQSGDYIMTGFVILSLCIPMGHMNFPFKLKKNSYSQWIETGLILLAAITLAITLIGLPATPGAVAYFILFVIYTWSKAF